MLCLLLPFLDPNPSLLPSSRRMHTAAANCLAKIHCKIGLANRPSLTRSAGQTPLPGPIHSRSPEKQARKCCTLPWNTIQFPAAKSNHLYLPPHFRAERAWFRSKNSSKFFDLPRNRPPYRLSSPFERGLNAVPERAVLSGALTAVHSCRTGLVELHLMHLETSPPKYSLLRL